MATRETKPTADRSKHVTPRLAMPDPTQKETTDS